ncbi:MAG TPA: immunoglobulin domain-containing protein [Candidatus Acidoferrales bacterium]|jgi:parallel beta-helix repeat protein|nr:immunoglobulin domain-containing protein [Candidatus Acidoferrales bacterium]
MKPYFVHRWVAGFICCAALYLLPTDVFAASAPSITTQPVSQQSLLVGSNATFSVVATGTAPLSYQWSINGTNLTNSAHLGGATTATLTVTNLVATDAGNYQVLVSNSHGTATSSNAALTVLFPPAITNPPAAQTVILSSNTTFTVQAGGTAPLGYQWKRNGTNLVNGGRVSGATNATLNLSNIQTNDAAPYQVVVTNNYGSATSAPVALTVLVPVTLTTQPTNQTVYVGDPVVFNVLASGTAPLTYQWLFNGTNLIGQTNATLSIAAATLGQAGPYSVTVTNPAGALQSSNATLTVQDSLPVILSQPTGQTDYIGTTLTLQVSATGSKPLTYQWQFANVDIAGATNATLQIANMTEQQAGNYQVFVSNHLGTTPSSLAAVSVPEVKTWGSYVNYDLPGLTNVLLLAAGAVSSWVMESDGTSAMWGNVMGGVLQDPDLVQAAISDYSALGRRADNQFLWWGNFVGTPPSDLTNCLSIAAGALQGLALRPDGTIAVWAEANGFGLTNPPAGLTNIVSIAAGYAHCLALRADGAVIAWGDNFSGQCNVPAGLSNVVSLVGGFEYSLALRSDGTLVGWGNYPPIPAGLSNVVAVASGDTSVLALMPDGTVVNWGESDTPPGLTNIVQIGCGRSHNSVLMASPFPRIMRQPANVTVNTNVFAYFYAPAVGRQPLYYQWRFNGTNLSGQTRPNLILAGAQSVVAGKYSVVVSNAFGSVTSADAMLAFTPPYIVTQPSNQVVNVSGNASLAVVASGTPNLAYQWFFNSLPLTDGGRVSGSATPNLNIANVQVPDGGFYSVVVTNNYGMVTSATVVLSATWGTPGVVRFVNASSTNPVAPYTSLNTAATNIQAAINASTNTVNDTVLVFPGVYNESVNFKGKPVWLLSAGGPANTIIRPPAGSGSVAFGNNESSNSILCGFTLTNGGISVGSCSPTIISNVLVNCGTGIDCEFASPYILNNLITGGSGDGIHLGGADSVYIAGNTIQNNASGISMFAAGSPTFFNNVIQNNRGSGMGMVNQCDANIVQNLIINNNGDGITGLVPSGARGPWVINNTICGNSGNGIYEDGFVSSGEIINNIVVGSPALSMNPWYGLPPPAVQFNDFYSTNGNVFSGVFTNVNSGNGDISTDPLFVAAAGGNFHLSAGSPCIDAGTNGAPLLPLLDLDGFPRIIAGNGAAIADLGAYELHSPSYIAIQSPPAGLNLIGGQNALFTVAATSPLPLTCQWRLNSVNLPGATSTTLFIANVQSNNAGIYDVLVSNAVTGVTSSPATLAVAYPPPVVVMQPTAVALLAGNNVAFSCVVTGYFALNYQWQLNGTNLVNGGRISGATTMNLNLTGVVTNDSGNYQLVASDYYHSVTGSVAPLTVWQSPAVLSPPADAVASIYGSCSLSVTVTGAPPVSLQWQKNGVNLTDGGTLSGSGTTTLTITNLQFADAGRYAVVASNASGTATAGCQLTVLPIVLWGYAFLPIPVSATNVVAVAAGGDYGQYGDFNLALRGDGTVVAWGVGAFGSTNVPPEATNVVAIAAGDYHGLALRRDGTVVGWGDSSYGESTPPAGATNVVAIAAGQRHSLALRQDGTVIGWGENTYGESTPPAGATNVIAISGGSDFSLALRQDGTVLGWGYNSLGQISPSAATTNVVAIAAGHWHGLALGQDGTVTAWGYAGNGASDLIPPPNATNVIAVSAGNSDSFVLRRDGTVVGWGYDFAGELDFLGNLTNVVEVSAKEYHGLALVQDPSLASPPGIWQPPLGGTPATGQTFILTTVATGSQPVSYQWLFNGAPLAGQTNNWLALVAINTNQAGGYQVIVTNNFGAVTSQVAVVSEVPGFVSQPASQIAFAGNGVSFSGSATGAGPFGYQWYFNGTPLTDSAHVSGSASTNLNLSNVQLSDAGAYALVVTNAAGANVTPPAVLKVVSQPTNSLVLLLGNTFTLSVTNAGPGAVLYQWEMNGVNLVNGGRISGATNASLAISGAQPTDTGSYQVIAMLTNNFSTATSAVASVTVMIGATITRQPASQAVLIGSFAQFSAGVSGTYLGYQWFKNGVSLADDGHFSGTASSILSIFPVQAGDVGGYVLFASNALTSVTSQVASLTPLVTQGPSFRYVNVNGTNPVTPFLDWTTAATNIQDAIDAAVAGDFITVTDGVYQVGGRVMFNLMTNRVAINKAVTVQSVNGPAVTTIRGNRPQGNSAVRCVYVTNNAVLSGFTLLGGGTRTTGDLLHEECGGGAWCESTNARLIGCLIISNVAWLNGGGEAFGTLSNCTLSGNIATNGSGGGTYIGRLNSCVLSNNYAQFIGGGSYSNILNGCTLAKNIARGFVGNGSTSGGGAALGVLNNCTLTGNFSLSGGGAAQCTLYFCTIISNTASQTGGGVNACIVNGCILAGNLSTNYGGGAFSSTLYNSLLWHNRTFASGGAAQNCDLYNCTVTGNTSGNDAGGGLGGLSSGTARNCIVYYNVGINSYVTFMTNCCTLPLPVSPNNGGNNFTNPPLFVDTNADFHLQSGSPCINAEKNNYATNAADLDGNPRIAGGTVDMGAYEFQSPSSVLSYAWAQQYGLPTDGSADFADSDGDGMNNWQEWKTGTVPTNAASVLQMASPSNSVSGVTVRWQSVIGLTYYLQRSSNLAAQPPFSSIQSNIVSKTTMTGYTDTSATNSGQYYYRVGVQ